MELHYQSDYHRCHRYRRPDRSTKLYVAPCAPLRWLSFIAVPRRKENSFRRRLADKIISNTVDSVTSVTISTSPAMEKFARVGAHCRDHNTHSIGICYEGGLDIAGHPQDTRTLAQRGSLLALLRELRKRFPKALIVGHHDLNPMKECPCFNCIKEYGEL